MAKGQVFLLFIACLSLSGCKKGGCNVVDYIPFQATVSLVKYNELRLLMQPVALGPEHGGVAGLIVLQVSEGEYVAFDRCSTVNPEKRWAVELERSDEQRAGKVCASRDRSR